MPSSKQHKLYVMGIKNEEDTDGKWSMRFDRRNNERNLGLSKVQIYWKEDCTTGYHSQQLKSEFEKLVMKEDESINSFAGKLMSKRKYGRRGGGNKTRGRGQGRFTRDSKNKDSYDKRWRNPGDQNYHRRDIREIECYNCHEFGHYAVNCPKPDHREEKANLVFEDDEPTLLMVTSEDEMDITSLKETKGVRANAMILSREPSKISEGKPD
ncbi:zinc finger, CCHC-type containing protein [Tanacetum coccineum]|uniref:Zinc finger, CCHC-type containing protein n=1 Tax=Tanacetum coccineum TaxID=301880 RepID=A0ABQ4Y876_9ASTR